MSAHLITRAAPGTTEWHAARAGRLGGSEIAAVVGLSPYESRFSLWHRKAGRIGPQPESPEMEWGKRLEPVVVAKFLEDHPEYEPVTGGTFVNDERPYQTAGPDLLLRRLLADESADSLLEVKTDRYDYEWGPGYGDDTIPPGYRCQVMWYLDTFGLEQAHVAALFSGSDYREYVITYDEADALLLRQAAEEFLASIAKGERPPLDGHNATYQAVRELHPLINGESVQIPVGVATEYLIARQDAATAKARLQEQTAAVADLMGDARVAVCNDFVIATRQAKGLDGTPYVVAGRNLPTPDELTAGEAA